MMTTHETRKRARVDLDCGHERWFLPPLPPPGALIYCPPCTRYETVCGETAAYRKVIHDGFITEAIAKGKIRATCAYTTECAFVIESKSLRRLENDMNAHHNRVHGYLRATAYEPINPKPPLERPDF